MSLGYEMRDHVAVVTLNRPEALNSLDPETRLELHDLFARIRVDKQVRVVVLTGTGPKAFCTGSDLKKTLPGSESFATLTFGTGQEPQSSVAALDIEQPIICAINGLAVAGGLEMALACDIRIAVDSARFGLSEVKVGSMPGGGGTQRLPRIVGMTNAMPMLLTGGLIGAEEALRIGLVSELLSAEDLMPRALAIAEQIAANAPLAVKAVKRVVTRGGGMALDDGIELERFAFGVLRDTEDRIEGRTAFAEKRRPVYVGK
ncbi:MAG TPA: enoyl-CoA hydratase-related protein [Devosia sp.]|nr:enoyl-CoA hydratase-related protein [Devosia sp.]